MPASDVVLAMLRGYAARAKQTQIRFSQFAAFVRQYSETHQQKNASLRMFVENTEGMVAPVLQELAESGRCTLEYDGSQIKNIVFLPFLLERIHAAFAEVEQDPDTPFPNEERLQLGAPQSITTVNIKTDFVQWLSNADEEAQVLRLSFPEGIANMFVPTDLLKRKLLELAMLKVRNYLAAGTNAGYMLQRLREIFTLKDQVIQNMIRDAIQRPSVAVDGLVNGTEFTFAFWAHLVSTIVKDYKTKNEKLPQEHGYCQAAYLIGLYNVYHKGLLQRDKEIEVSLKSVEKKLTDEPFYFTISDIYDFRDDKGVPYLKRCPRNKLDEFIESKTKSANENVLPDLLRLRSSNKKEYFIHKGVVLRLTLNKIFAASREYKDAYTAEWFENLGDFKKTPIMLNDEVFLRDLEAKVKQEDPLLHTLLSYDLLYLVRKESTADDEINRRIDRILDQKKQALIPLDLLLGVRRKEMLTEARLKLPLWKTIPVLKHILRLFDRMAGGGRSSRSGGRDTIKMLGDDDVETTRGRRHRGGADGAPNLEEAFGDYAMPEAGELGDGHRGREESPVGAGSTRGHESAAESAVGGAGAGRGGSGNQPSAAATSAAAQNAKARAAAYRKAVGELQEKLIGKGKPLDSALKELAEKWNPLFADKAKRNLVEDVNSFLRDQVRTLRRSVLRTPPDLERIQNLSDQISTNEIFEEIKRKDEFREYIKLYLIKILGAA